MDSNTRKIVIYFLIFTTFVLGGIAIVVSVGLQSAPPTNGVTTCPTGTFKTNSTSGLEVCQCSSNANLSIAINSIDNSACGTTCSSSTEVGRDLTSDERACGFDTSVYYSCDISGNLNTVDCPIGTSCSGNGQCLAEIAGEGATQCGGSCTQDINCKTPATGGLAVCRNGKCENNACPAGNTIPGANCACNFANSCGQPCGISVGLCTAGLNCGFVGSPNACLENEGNVKQQFCLPNSPANGYALRVCNGIAANLLLTPSGGLTSTQAQVIEACTPIAVTTTCYSCSSSLTDGNECVPTTVSGTTCPAGSSTQVAECASQVGGSCPVQGSTSITCYRCSSSGVDGNTCESFVFSGTACPTGSSIEATGCAGQVGGSCSTTALPDTAIFSDRIDRVILGVVVIILGLSLAGTFDKLRANRRPKSF